MTTPEQSHDAVHGALYDTNQLDGQLLLPLPDSPEYVVTEAALLTLDATVAPNSVLFDMTLLKHILTISTDPQVRLDAIDLAVKRGLEIDVEEARRAIVGKDAPTDTLFTTGKPSSKVIKIVRAQRRQREQRATLARFHRTAIPGIRPSYLDDDYKPHDQDR